MYFGVRRILILISISNGQAFARMLEYVNIQKHTLPIEDCDLIMVSDSRINKGTQHKLFPEYILRIVFFRFWEGCHQVSKFSKSFASKRWWEIQQVSDSKNVLLDSINRNEERIWGVQNDRHYAWVQDSTKTFGHIHGYFEYHCVGWKKDKFQCDDKS